MNFLRLPPRRMPIKNCSLIWDPVTMEIIDTPLLRITREKIRPDQRENKIAQRFRKNGC